MKNIKKYISILLITLLISVHNVPFAIAEEVASDQQTAPATESQNTTTTQTTDPSVTPVQDQQSATPTPTQAAVPTPTLTKDQQEDAARKAEYDARKAVWESERDARKAAALKAAADAAAAAAASNTSPATSSSPATGGDTKIKTGDATNASVITSSANNNGAGVSPTSGSGATVANTGNGSGSNNNGSAVIGNNNTTNQNNGAVVNNNLNSSTTTGSNNASGNTGGDSSIKTGDANVTGTVVTTLNTNAAGVMVSEFNVNDDHVGDIVLDFAANCISGCGGSSAAAVNSGNGADSTNTSNTNLSNNSDTFQNNDASVGNGLVLSANSGDNTTSKNTNGDSKITTGDANVSANVVTLANNNIAGNVVYGVVNIFGDLIGDVVLTEDMMNACCGTGNSTASNTGNGSGSTNTSDANLSNNNNTFQNNDANITNNLVFDAQTGNNDASNNTGGSSAIKTGDSTVQANVLNIANSNIIGGNMWLVIVNEAGHWVGKLLGAPAGQNYSGGEGAEFMVDENGNITAAINAGNGSDSTNNSSANQTNNTTTTQNNTANINNTLDLSANTGGNAASKNTGGSSDITTGDAKIVANLVNFVNNNIVGKGKLFVTVINVFGSWMGDFVAPGQHKEVKQDQVLSDNKGSGDKSHAKTPTPTPGKTITVMSKTTKKTTSNNPVSAVMGASDTNNDNSNVSTGNGSGSIVFANSSVNSNKALVKEASIDKTIEAGAKGLTLNLAWVLILAPLGFIAILGKKYIYKKNLPTV